MSYRRFYSDVFVVYLCTLFVYVCVLVYAESISFSLNGGGGGETFFFPFLTKRLATVIDPMIDHFRDTFANTRNFTHLLSFYRFASHAFPAAWLCHVVI